MALGPDENSVKAKRKWLAEIFTNFKNLAGNFYSFEDSEFHLKYRSFCSPAENIFATILITPSDRSRALTPH